jgi:hypothetical protein
MTEAASTAARRLSAQRWGSQRPVRLAHELATRVDELPDAERARLLEALTTETRQTADLAGRVNATELISGMGSARTEGGPV